MNDNSNVSVEKIQEGIDYLQESFMKPLVSTGQNIIDDYEMLNKYLHSEKIDVLIKEQKDKLDEIKRELETICNKAKGQMEDSSKRIKQNVANIDSNLGNI